MAYLQCKQQNIIFGKYNFYNWVFQKRSINLEKLFEAIVFLKPELKVQVQEFLEKSKNLKKKFNFSTYYQTIPLNLSADIKRGSNVTNLIQLWKKKKLAKV